jgi:predicted PurR-regulated permease PerM
MDEQDRNSVHENEITLQVKHAYYFLFGLIFLAFWGCFTILRPFLNTIILAIILATVFGPVHRWIDRIVGGRRNLAALLSCMVMTIVVVAPLTAIAIATIQEAIHSFNSINEWIRLGKYNQLLEVPAIAKLVAAGNDYMTKLAVMFPDLDPRKIKIAEALINLTSSIGQTLVSKSGQIIANVTSLIGKFFLLLFVFFFIVRDEDRIFQTVRHLVPLSTSNEERIIARIKAVARSALLGALVSALILGISGGFAFWVAGLPAFFWGMVMGVASFVPIFGTYLVFLPAAGLLVLSGYWGYALFMVIWCAAISWIVEHFVRPWLMKESAETGTLLIFLAILGGISYYGLIGLLYGPLILGLTMVLLYIYSQEFASFLDEQDKI